ncbi:NAD(P)H dehydrogenase (quinone) [Tenacibaculum adriaticum]|uniref:NAD(P)H dehydrogenase (Quinone) n=1 Tax=Tenacibaculum adriaticum TaxID=413713 RepID=A0A5S5DR00_9FLAO|nr:SDR family oxidoreductase [Tenacibaculum adriaticum]TYP98155.1 NAD(P)H dehydrogenase (quinone) [Tenacibaculum adriaticum]
MKGNTLITGVTGNLGRLVLNNLLEEYSSDQQLSILVRDINKATDFKNIGITVYVGDYNNYDSLVSAFKNIDNLYFVSGNDIVNRTKQHENVIGAAKEAGVKHVVYTSFIRENETETSPIARIAHSHLKTENWLKNSGIDYTILKHTIYADFIPMFLGENFLETGIAYLPAGEGKNSFVTRNDMAEVGAKILTSLEAHKNKEYNIVNENTISFRDIVSQISEITGKPIQYISPTQLEYIETLTKSGVPKDYIGMFTGFAEAFKQEEFIKTGTTIQSLIGRKPTSINEFLTQVYQK